MSNIIEIKGLNKSFKDVKAVRDLSLKVREGELFAFLGVNGAGKSTFLNTASGEKISIVSPVPQTTRNAVRGIVNTSLGQLVFVDTPGYHRSRTKLGDYMVNVARESIADVDATILVVEPVANIGGQEAENRTVAVRNRKEGDCGVMSLEQIVAKLEEEIRTKAH